MEDTKDSPRERGEIEKRGPQGEDGHTDQGEQPFNAELVVNWNPPELTDKELEDLNGFLGVYAGGGAPFVPRVCPGPSCDQIASCPLHKQGIPLPVGKQCFVELSIVRQSMQAMANELDTHSYFDVISIGSIALNQILVKRAAEVLANEAIIADSFRAITPQGEAIFERKAHPAVGVLDRFQKRNQEIQSDLLATRKEKSKDDARKSLSPSETAKRIREKMAQSRKGLASAEDRLREHYQDEGVVDAEFTVEDTKESTTEEKGEEKRDEEKPKRDPNTGLLM